VTIIEELSNKCPPQEDHMTVIKKYILDAPDEIIINYEEVYKCN
jgi:hypothetical protein